MDEITLKNVSMVCSRWNYLTKTNELWLYKCFKLGIDENLGRLENYLLEEMLNNEEVDWKQAYIELKMFINELKSNYIENNKPHYRPGNR